MSDNGEFANAGNGQTNGAGSGPNGDAEEAIAALFDDYQAGFNDYDVDRICDCFAMPAIIWQHDKGHVFNDEEELIENIEALLKALEKEGVSHSDFQVVSSHVSGSAALVTLDWSQETADGEAVFEFTCHYQLIQDGSDWVIGGVINE
ncbi:nuclear transport factor 2 family protein [Roseibium aggregatum]|uniref:Nuclear transport factor 2 family protein n=1 Tax=Roseibium aggregatum TaxID=187304 RepID=A0A939EAH5_9HYPH|nr:nuclear transport factor 2 family protein [Roseibium aggregatum]MBN9669348.1 nuclear transport factor 2 family protein [Roseibium aggregatum]